jgi:hypothetical protein
MNYLWVYRVVSFDYCFIEVKGKANSFVIGISYIFMGLKMSKEILSINYIFMQCKIWKNLIVLKSKLKFQI